MTSLLHRPVEGPVADDRMSSFPPDCCCWQGTCREGLRRRGGRRRGRGPGGARSRPCGAAKWSCAGSGPLPRAWAQLPVDCVLLLGWVAGAAAAGLQRMPRGRWGPAIGGRPHRHTDPHVPTLMRGNTPPTTRSPPHQSRLTGNPPNLQPVTVSEEERGGRDPTSRRTPMRAAPDCRPPPTARHGLR